MGQQEQLDDKSKKRLIHVNARWMNRIPKKLFPQHHLHPMPLKQQKEHRMTYILAEARAGLLLLLHTEENQYEKVKAMSIHIGTAGTY